MDEPNCYVPYFSVVTNIDAKHCPYVVDLIYFTIVRKLEFFPSGIRNDIRRNLKWQKRK